jgi:Dipeptidyl aminopeptidases/acylaminoacyl-peptidases
MKRFAVAGLAVLLMGAAPASNDYQNVLTQLHITSVRGGADGMNPKAPNFANFDESRAGSYTLPDPLTLTNGKAVTTPDSWWTKRRPEIAAQFETEVYGRLPANIPPVHWQATGAEVPNRAVKAITTHFIGHVGADPAHKVAIAMDLTLPAAHEKPVPVMIVLTWHGPWDNAPVPPGQGADWRDQLLAAGWGYAEYIPTTVQADDPNKLNEGIIGLVNNGAPRPLDQWGALRAWAWGVSRVIDLLATDKRVDAKRIGVAGHSRYGKAALVAMAFEPRLAIGYISSSGAGGAKLLRRNFGETLENLAGDGEHHWMAGNFVAYAGPKTARDLPVDAHELIALVAPRPLFLSAGIGDGTKPMEDGWTDQRGMFLATVAAGPVYRLLGAGDLGTDAMPPVGTEVTKGALAWRQHPFGHTMQPNWTAFLAYAKTQLTSAPQK